MQTSRILIPLEETRDSQSHRAQSRVSQFKILKFLFLFIVLGSGFVLISLYKTRYIDLQAIVMQAHTSFTPCSDEQGSSLSRWIKGPSNLMHEMNDTELFWLASVVPQVKNYPFKRVPKVAFMFLTKGDLPLFPLWEKFFIGNEGLYSIYIHSLPNYQPRFPQSSVFYQRQIPSQVAEWGRMSMCDAERRLLANALLDLSNERFVLLSESCIPLFPFPIVHSFLTRSNHSFIGSFDDPGPYGRGRYNPNMLPEVEISQWRKGSQWFEVNRALAISIISDTKYYPKFEQFCRPACYVDEHYFPTMLTIESPSRIANRSLTRVDWSRGGPHPATFGRADVTEGFLRRLVGDRSCTVGGEQANNTVCFLFARKFAPSALEPLLGFAPRILGFG